MNMIDTWSPILTGK